MNQKALKKLHDELQAIMSGMVSNTYLLPSTWADARQLSASPLKYRTYCNDNRDYVSIEFSEGRDMVLSQTINSNNGLWDMRAEGSLFTLDAKKKLQEVMALLRLVYNEMHSFNPDATALKTIRSKISAEKEKMAESANNIASLEQQIKDFKKI